MKIRSLTVLALIALAAPAAAATRVAGKISLAPAAYPPEAQKKGIDGNVVLTGEVTADGRVAGLHALATSSPLLTDAAIRHVQDSKFGVNRKDGAPVAILLNVVVRFRNDRAKPADTGSMPAAIVGNFAVMPAAADGRASGPEGFAVEPGDHGIRGELDVDLPRGSAGKTFRVRVTDELPGGKTAPVMDRNLTPDRVNSIGAVIFRRIDASRREEQGIHTLTVTVDGKNAGGARYRVAGAAPSPAPSRPRKK